MHGTDKEHPCPRMDQDYQPYGKHEGIKKPCPYYTAMQELPRAAGQPARGAGNMSQGLEETKLHGPIFPDAYP